MTADNAMIVNCAPEGATHYSRGGMHGGITCGAAYWGPHPDGGYKRWAVENGTTRFCSPNSWVDLPDYAVPLSNAGWNGQGLPPVGMVCEFQGDTAACAFDPWHADLRDGAECTVIAHFKSKGLDLVAFTFVKPDGNTELEQALPGALRPIRTAEQIEAEVRDKAIEAMASVITDNPELYSSREEVLKYCSALYDANYRKQVEP